ncbi:MAG TPA: N-acetylneuraminate synthase family protein [Sumerlaeia bacterium]|nr:N-acetylneuraminate synthase family protein [Sumerlaeia bacterium]
MAECVRIGERFIGPGHPCFVIAEAGVNHNGSLDRALRLVEAAKSAGADAVKFQLYRVEEQVSGAAVTAAYQRERTGSGGMREMAESYDLPWDAHRDIAAHCRDAGVAYMASCFDPQAIDFLMELGGQSIKIASGEITNYPLLEYAAKTGKPILLSTGMCEMEDVAGAVERIRESGPSPLALFHCVSDYPTDPRAVNLRVMKTLADAFGVPVGFSDHTEGHAVAAAAVALGACMIEKHFTTDKTLPGPDHAMSLAPRELEDFVAAVRAAEAALGDGVKRMTAQEKETQRVARRSLVSARDIEPGETLGEENVCLKRPAAGIDPREWGGARGRRAAIRIPADTPIAWEMLK